MKKKLLLCLGIFSSGITLFAQTSPTAQTLPYSQDFSSLAHSATTYPSGIQGWTIATAPGSAYNTSSPSADRTLVASSSASVNSGNVHNYNGKIGWLNSSSLDLGLVLAINTSGKKNIELNYDIMTIRNPYDSSANTRINEVTVQYRIGTSGTFTTLTGIEYQNNTLTQTASGVTTPQKLESKSILLPSDCDSEAVVQLRWVSKQVSGAGSRPSFAIDNIDIDTAAPVFNVLNITPTTNAIEGLSPTAGVITFNYSPALATVSTFNYKVSGTATLGTDYTITLSGGTTPSSISSSTGTISIPSGLASFTATINPVNDAMAEGLENISITISSASAPYTIDDSIATINLLDDEHTPIHSIQGAGMTAISGSYTVEAIVTGVYPTLSPAGFYIQEEDADMDADIKTSEGIFVVSSTAVAIGDKVKVVGNALESTASPSFSQAVISASAVSIMSSGNPMPTASNIKLPLSDTNDFEQYEGMIVRFVDTLTVTDNYNLGRYGEIGLSQGGILYQPSQIVDLNDPTASGTTASGKSNLAAISAQTLQNKLRSILLDDGRGTIPTLPYVNADSTLRIGSTIDSLWGIMGYAFSKYRIQPTSLPNVKINFAPRPSLPNVGAAANVRIASFNVLNYFNGDGAGGGFPTARGAHSAAEFTRQRDKIINALVAINADVVGLIEIENDGIGSNSAIQDLVNGINAVLGAGSYSIINDGASIQTNCTDAIRCGIIYKSSVVTPIGSAMISTNTIFNRPPLAQAFKVNSSDSLFSFVINHFKSKSCSGSTGANTDQADGQACYNELRKQQAGELVNYIQSTIIPTAGTNNIISMGDYNAYFEEDPLDSIRSKGFVVLSNALNYSYQFGGMMGSLDNAFVSSTLNSRVTGIAKWTINSPEPTHLGYDDLKDDGGSDFANPWAGTYSSSPFRSSDHDPVIVGLNLSKKTGIAESQKASFSIYPNPAKETISVAYSSSESGKISISNPLGQTIESIDIVAGKHTQTIAINALANGIYILKMTNKVGEVIVQKFVKN